MMASEFSAIESRQSAITAALLKVTMITAIFIALESPSVMSTPVAGGRPDSP